MTRRPTRDARRARPRRESPCGVAVTPIVVIGPGDDPYAPEALAERNILASQVVPARRVIGDIPALPPPPADFEPLDLDVAGRDDPPSGVQPLQRDDARWLDALQMLSELAPVRDPAWAFDRSVALLARHIPCEAVGGALYESGGDRMRYVVGVGQRASRWAGRVVSARHGLVGRAVTAGPRLRVSHDAGLADGFDADVDSCPGVFARNLALRPLFVAGRPVGLLHLVNRGGPLSFSDAELDLVEYVASGLTAALLSPTGLG